MYAFFLWYLCVLVDFYTRLCLCVSCAYTCIHRFDCVCLSLSFSIYRWHIVLISVLRERQKNICRALSSEHSAKLVCVVCVACIECAARYFACRHAFLLYSWTERYLLKRDRNTKPITVLFDRHRSIENKYITELWHQLYCIDTVCQLFENYRCKQTNQKEYQKKEIRKRLQ